jgi:poly(A) polymerase
MKPAGHRQRRALARGIVARLRARGHLAFWVGGCVRDTLLGREPGDYDIATSARPEQVEALFRHTVPVGRQFGVILVVVRGVEFQVSTFRAETGYSDGRRPDEVRFTNAMEDACRRDLTVNGLFFDPITGTLHDWVGGRADLEARLIRLIGDPAARLGEDHLRLLRVVRFAAQLEFEIEEATFTAVKAHAALIGRVSAERIRDELLKLFAPPHAARGLDLLRDSGLLREVLPEVAAFETCEQPPDHHPEGTVYEHVRRMLALLPAGAPPALAWSVLLHDVAKPLTARRDPRTGAIQFHGHEQLGEARARDILRRLRFPNREIETVAAVVRYHMQFKDVPHMRKTTLRRLVLRETFPLELELHRLDCLGSHGRLDHYELVVREAAAVSRRPEIKPPLARGDDLIALGMKPGRELGALLAEIRERQLQDELTSREAALAFARERLGLTARPAGGEAGAPVG